MRRLQAIAGRSTKRKLSQPASSEGGSATSAAPSVVSGSRPLRAQHEQQRHVPEVEPVGDDAGEGQRAPGQRARREGRRDGDDRREARRGGQVAHHCDIVGHPQARLPNRLHGANGGGVVRGKHRIDARAHREKPLHGTIPVALHEPCLDEPLGSRLHPSHPERVAPAFLATLGVRDVRAADVGNGLAPHIKKVRGCKYAHPFIVGEHAVTFDLGMIIAIDHDNRRPKPGQLPQQVVVGRPVRRREHDAVDLAAAQHFELGAFLGRILTRAAQEQAVAAHTRDRFDAGNDLDEERVHQIGDRRQSCGCGGA